jgi:hypothetical protein
MGMKTLERFGQAENNIVMVKYNPVIRKSFAQTGGYNVVHSC